MSEFGHPHGVAFRASQNCYGSVVTSLAVRQGQ